MAEVKVRINFEYHPLRDQPFAAEVTLYLPANGEILCEEFLSNEILLGERLSKTWGMLSEDEEGFVCKSTMVTSEHGWQDVKEKAIQLAKELVEKVRTIRQKNMEIIQSKPDDFVMLFEV